MPQNGDTSLENLAEFANVCDLCQANVLLVIATSTGSIKMKD